MHVRSPRVPPAAGWGVAAAHLARYRFRIKFQKPDRPTNPRAWPNYFEPAAFDRSCFSFVARNSFFFFSPKVDAWCGCGTLDEECTLFDDWVKNILLLSSKKLVSNVRICLLMLQMKLMLLDTQATNRTPMTTAAFKAAATAALPCPPPGWPFPKWWTIFRYFNFQSSTFNWNNNSGRNNNSALQRFTASRMKINNAEYLISWKADKHDSTGATILLKLIFSEKLFSNAKFTSNHLEARKLHSE